MDDKYAIEALLAMVPNTGPANATKVSIEVDKPWKKYPWKDYFPFIAKQLHDLPKDPRKDFKGSYYGSYDGVAWFAQSVSAVQKTGSKPGQIRGFVIMSGHPWDCETRSSFVSTTSKGIATLAQMNPPRMPQHDIEAELSTQQSRLNQKVAQFAAKQNLTKARDRVEALTQALIKAKKALHRLTSPKKGG